MLLTENFLVIVKVVFDVAIGEDTVMDGEVLVNGIKFGWVTEDIAKGDAVARGIVEECCGIDDDDVDNEAITDDLKDELLTEDGEGVLGESVEVKDIFCRLIQIFIWVLRQFVLWKYKPQYWQ